jgi:hypothetical protein
MMADKASPTRALLDTRPVVECGIGWRLPASVGIPVMSRPSVALVCRARRRQKPHTIALKMKECALPDYLVCAYVFENKSFIPMSRFEKRGLPVATNLSRADIRGGSGRRRAVFLALAQSIVRSQEGRNPEGICSQPVCCCVVVSGKLPLADDF